MLLSALEQTSIGNKTRSKPTNMDTIMGGWFSELNELWPGVAHSLYVNEVLHHEHSKYQEIMVIKTKSHGRALILDGIIQCTEKDEFSYQEMISFLPLCNHPNPKNVLIVGGGDGGVSREIAKHPSVECITQVEIDKRVIAVSRQYLPTMSKGFDNSKVNLIIGDGFEYMNQHVGEFDIIITDSSDPVGPAKSLFERSYYELLKNSLKPDGIICSQAGTVWDNLNQVKSTFDHGKDVFAVADYAITIVPTYPTGQIGFVLAGLNNQTNFREPIKIFSEQELDDMNIKYYNDKVHRAAFILPRFAEKALRPNNHSKD